MNKPKIVAVSGYFTVLHIGHIRYFKAAKRLGDKLIVIVNNNKQQILKKGKIIHSANDIKLMLKNFPFINKVIVSEDTDRTQNRTLEKIKPDIFAKGGDSNESNTPEIEICKKIGCQVKFNVGGKKLNSSSWILEKL